MAALMSDNKTSFNANGFLLNDRGQKDAFILIALVLASLAVTMLINSVVAFWFAVPGWETWLQNAVYLGLASGASGGAENYLESRNMQNRLRANPQGGTDG